MFQLKRPTNGIAFVARVGKWIRSAHRNFAVYSGGLGLPVTDSRALEWSSNHISRRTYVSKDAYVLRAE